MKNDIKIKSLKKSHPVTINVGLSYGFALRRFIAIRLIKIAGFLLGCGSKITENEET